LVYTKVQNSRNVDDTRHDSWIENITEMLLRPEIHHQTRWGAYSAPTDPLVGFDGRDWKEREGIKMEGREREGKDGKLK